MQACLIERPGYANKVLEAGLISACEQVVEKAMSLISFERKNQQALESGSAAKKIEFY